MHNTTNGRRRNKKIEKTPKNIYFHGRICICLGFAALFLWSLWYSILQSINMCMYTGVIFVIFPLSFREKKIICQKTCKKIKIYSKKIKSYVKNTKLYFYSINHFFTQENKMDKKEEGEEERFIL